MTETTHGLDMQHTVGLGKLRNAIPKHCFQSSYIVSMGYLARDLLVIATLFTTASFWIPSVQAGSLRAVAWIVYGWLQGLAFTGLWVLGHECGHGAFSPSPLINDVVGFLSHSFLLTPYFSWKLTHRRHHRYTGHMDRDNNHVPNRQSEYFRAVAHVFHDNAEDAPLYVLTRLAFQQVLGWPLYLLYGITGGEDSTARPVTRGKFLKNHFNPFSALFSPRDAGAVMASDIGIIANLAILSWASRAFGFWNVCFLYVQPFLWLNHWIVMVTYLQHTHPKVPRYEANAWTFVKGATATIDRDLGFVGRFFLHGVIDHHVVHHLFPRIPFYHGYEATEAIRPLLGDSYREDRGSCFLGLWQVYLSCQFVAPRSTAGKGDDALWFSGGRIPPLFNMSR